MIYKFAKGDITVPALLLALQEMGIDYSIDDGHGPDVIIEVGFLEPAIAHDLGMCHATYLQTLIDMVDVFTTKKIVS